jgi:hypothetical protein
MSDKEAASLAVENAVAEALVVARNPYRQVCDEAFADAGLSLDQAYQVQEKVARSCGWFTDGPPRFWKSGGAGRDAALTHAPLPPAGVWRSPANAGAWPLTMRGVEAEIALRLGQLVDPNAACALDLDAARALVDAMTVSIEVVDSRWRQGMATPAMLRLADQQSHGALVLGDWIPYRPIGWDSQICRVQIGLQPEVVKQGTHSLGDPTWLLPYWLRHATARYGALPAGTVVTTGTWVGILPAQAGDVVRVVFDGIGEASVRL